MKKRILSMILALAMVLSLGLSVFAEGEETQADIVDAAFALEPGASLEGTKTLTGEVSYIVTAYSEKYENVTVNIHVLDGSGNQKTIQCFQMKGDDAATVGVGDVITVTGTITNYNGLVEFGKACTFVTVSKATGDYQIKTFAGYSTEDVAIVVRQEGKTTIGEVTGKDYNYYRVILVDADGYVVEVLEKLGRVPQTPTEENPAHGPEDGRKDLVEIPEGGFAIGIHNNVIVADGSAYASLFGEGGVKAGDSIVVYGVDFEELATMAAQTALEGASFSVIPAFVPPTTEEEILAAAFALEPGTALPGGPYSLTGVVNKKTDNKTQVNITVGDKDVLCYQMNADDYAAIAVGDTVIVTGNIKNYNGVVEFDTGCTAEKVVVPEFDESLWEIFDPDTALWVDGVNAGKFQGNDENAACGNAYLYVYAYDKENVYVAVQTNYAAIGTAESYGNGVGTNLRLWFRTNDEAVVYTHFVDISYDGDETPVIGAKKNGSLTANSGATAIATDGVEAEAVAGEGTAFIQAKIPFSVIEATADFGMFVTLSNGKSGEIVNNCIIHPYDADCTFDKEGVDPTQNNTYFPYTSWNSAAIVIEAAEPVEPITEQIVDLEEVKILDVITFTADDPSIGTVRISGSYDGEEYYDLNNNGNVNVNADTGVATVNLNTQGYIQVRYLKVTGTDVHGTLTATYKNADEGAFIAPPYGPYDFGPKDGNPYCIVMLENRVVDINAVAGDDYAVSVKNNQLIITQKVANGVYKIIANSVNAWPSQGHPELITAGIEGLDIDEEGIITLAEDQFAFVIVSSGSIKTAGDEQTAPAKRIDRGLGVNGYWRVDGDKVTLHVNQPEPVEEPVEDPIQPAELETLPEGAIVIDYAGYKHAAFTSIIAGDNQTVAELTARGNGGTAKDLNYAYNILVGADNVVIATDYALGTPNTWTCPEGGYIITYNGNKAGYQVMADIEVGATITVYNVNLAPVRTLEGNVELTSAGFTYVNPEPTGDELPEGAIMIDYAQDWMGDICVIYVPLATGENTVGTITEITTGTAQDCTWWNAIVVDADGKVVKLIGMVNKTDEVIPEGGYMLLAHGESPALSVLASIPVNSTITLYNCDLEAFAELTEGIALTNAAFTYAEPEVERPISYQKPYTVAKESGAATYWSNSTGTVTLDDDGVIITDGKYGSLAGDTKGNYVALNQLASGAGIFVVDLGESYYVDKFDVHTVANSGWGIPQAKYIVVSYSTDGETFTQAGIIESDGEIFNGTGSGWTAYYHELQLDESVSARYVKFEVYTWANFLWIAEVEVWEGEEPEPMGDTTIDGVFDDDIWEGVEWTTYDGYTKGTWQQYQKKGTYTYKTAIAEDDDYIYFAGEVSCLNVTQIRLWFRTNPEASLYTHFVDVYSDGRNWIKKNQSLTENSGAELENKPVYALVELEGKTYVEIKVAKSDLDMDGDYDFIPQASVDGFSNLLGAEIIHGNFVYGGKTMTYFPWVGWPAAPEETYIGLIPVTNHWTFTDITSGDTVGVINKAHYERQADGSLRFVVGGTALYPLVSYNYEEAKVYDVARGTLNYKFTTDRHNTNITFIFEDANGAPYSFPLANSAAGFAEGQYNAGTGDILPGTYEGSIALADLIASTSLYGNNPFPEADATELKFIGIQIYACGITDPAGGVYIDDLSVTEEAAPEVNENVMDLGEVVTITGVTFTADNPDGLETVEILGSIDGVNYYRLNSEPAVTVTDGVATVNFAMANNNFRAFLNIRYIKVVGAPNVEGEIDIIEAAEEDVVKGIAPQGPYTQTGLNTNGYGIVVWTAEDAPEGFGLNDKGVYTDHDKALNLNSCMITIAEEVDEGVYKILWNDSNGWSKETGAAHLNTPEGVEGVDYRDGKVYLGENQIAMFIMSSGGYNTAGDGEFSTAKWILRGIVEGGYLRFGDETVEIFNEQPAAAASQEELSIADFDGDGDIDSDDAIYLLRAVLFPEDYEITLATPFYGDRNPTSDDAIYLLRHVLFPKDYPIPKE